jgi:hypothetical protein
MSWFLPEELNRSTLLLLITAGEIDAKSKGVTVLATLEAISYSMDA